MLTEKEWAQIEAARAALSKPPPMPPGFFSVAEYATRLKISPTSAANILKRMWVAGKLDRQKHGNGLAYRLK